MDQARFWRQSLGSREGLSLGLLLDDNLASKSKSLHENEGSNYIEGGLSFSLPLYTAPYFCQKATQIKAFLWLEGTFFKETHPPDESFHSCRLREKSSLHGISAPLLYRSNASLLYLTARTYPLYGAPSPLTKGHNRFVLWIYWRFPSKFWNSENRVDKMSNAVEE
jgi:hypothetical protein